MTNGTNYPEIAEHTDHLSLRDTDFSLSPNNAVSLQSLDVLIVLDSYQHDEYDGI